MTKKIGFTYRASLLLGAVGIGCFPTVAMAQTDPQNDGVESEAGSQGGNVDPANKNEIIVTARLRGEDLQSVPVAISVLSKEALAPINPRTIRDLSGTAPNLVFGGNPSNVGVASIFMRGLGYLDAERSQSPAVGVSIDGVILGTSTGALIDAFDIENIEILRGPQGLFFGKNTTGGLINIRRSAPTNDSGVTVSASVGSYDERIGRIVFNTGELLGGGARLKLAYNHREDGGFGKNLYTGERDGGENYDMIHAIMDLDVSEDVTARLVFDRTWANTEGLNIQAENRLTSSIRGVPGGSLNGLKPYETLADFPNRGKLDFTRVSAELTAATSIGQITTVSGWVRSPDVTDTDFDGACLSDLQGLGCSFQPNPVLRVLHLTRSLPMQQITQEVRLLSDTREDWNLPFDAIVTTGYYYYDMDGGNTTITRTDATGFGFTVNEPVARSDARIQVRSNAVFGNIELEAVPNFFVSAGVRHISETQKFDSAVNGRDFTQPGVVFSNARITPIHESIKNSDTLTNFEVRYEAPSFMVYAKRAEGIRSGGFSIRGTLSETFPDQPNYTDGSSLIAFGGETVTSYEAGFKSQLFDNQLVFNVAAFMLDLKGSQNLSTVVTRTPDGLPFLLGTNSYIYNNQKTEIKGLEVDGSFKPSFAPGLKLGFSLGILDAEVTEALISNRLLAVGPNGTPGNVGSTDLSGSPVIYAPDFNYSLSGAYEFSLSDDIVGSVNLFWRYQDDVILRVLGDVPDIEPGYGVMSGNIRIAQHEGWWIDFSAQNLLDKDYRVASSPSTYFQGWGTPRRFQVEVGTQF